jgi:endonuclease/exonuclease/phosphatase family metal-dependent hydrolase
VVIAVAAAAILLIALPASAGANQGGQPAGDGQGKTVDVMTRNLYLGAVLDPAIAAGNFPAFVQATGQIVREVDENDFPVRAQGLADEILSKKPDLVGLQEVALWRTATPANLSGGPPSATTVRYDYLKELLAALNSGNGNNGNGKPQYEVVVVQPEFDLEAPADVNGDLSDGPAGAELSARLTMRDVILARRGAGVQTWDEESANFEHLLPIELFNGQQLLIRRGWTATDAKVRGSHAFRFVNTHLESFHPIVRQEQAAELVAPGGPATSNLPVILVGDLNSDKETVSFPDTLAYETLLGAGMVERSTNDPLGCCLQTSLLEVGKGGNVSQFDHQVDHIMTRDPQKVTLRNSTVTGLQPVNNFWDSDHAGLFSSLSVR